MHKLISVSLLLAFMLLSGAVHAQNVSFKKNSLSVKEPYEESKGKTDTIELELKVEGFKKGTRLKADPIQIGKGSTYKGAFTLITKAIDSLKGKNVIELALTTDAFSDEDNFILINVNYEDMGDTAHTKMQITDTVFVANVYPFKATQPKEYTNWNDGKRAEIFIGTNFDFYGENTLTDWYGGTSIFLPGITDFKYHNGKTNSEARWGINAGLYHSRSFSNFGNGPVEEYDNITRKTLRTYFDTINNVRVPALDYQQDSITVKTKTEINNWAAYAGLMYQFSRYESSSDNFITNIFVGVHAEIIRRSVNVSYTFDTLSTSVRTIYAENVRFTNRLPRNNKQTYYDGYFGVNMPVQFLWKDIIDLKIIPCLGIGSASHFSSPDKTMPSFYLFNFDLLARLGGLRLNLGGEIRGYFPQSPILSAYLGTSFSVSKLVDFISK
jgi:hypothetical protein